MGSADKTLMIYDTLLQDFTDQSATVVEYIDPPRQTELKAPPAFYVTFLRTVQSGRGFSVDIASFDFHMVICQSHFYGKLSMSGQNFTT